MIIRYEGCCVEVLVFKQVVAKRRSGSFETTWVADFLKNALM
jgi:hypothetical protein